MLQKFKMRTYVTLLLIGLFVLPYVVEAVDRIENATDRFSCGESLDEVKNCLEAVISTRDATIDQLNTRLFTIGTESAWHTVSEIDKLKHAVVKAEQEVVKLQAGVGWWLKKLIRKKFIEGCGVAVDGIESATDRFGCGESVEEVRNCLEAVISSRDATIDQLNTRLINSEVAEQDKKIEELQNAFWRAEGEVKKLQVGVGWWLKKLIRKTMSGCGWEHIPYPQVTRP
jgi:uncharacterized coiled-coil protein SlyX